MANSKEKVDAINAYLKDEYMLIHFDARKPGIELPEHLLNNPTVTLKLSYEFQGGMEVNEERIWASLLFSGKYKDCFVPINSIWGATSCSGANTIWPEDAPPEVMMQVIETLANRGVAEPQKIDAVLQEASTLPKAKKTSPAKRPKSSRPNHLRRIK